MTHYRQDERGRLFRWDAGLGTWFRLVSHDDEYEEASRAIAAAEPDMPPVPSPPVPSPPVPSPPQPRRATPAPRTPLPSDLPADLAQASRATEPQSHLGSYEPVLVTP